MQYSATQGSNILAFVGVLMIVLKYLHINIAEDEVQTIIGAAITLIGIIVNWIHRYQKGDLTKIGFRK